MNRVRYVDLIAGLLIGIVLSPNSSEAQYTANFQTNTIDGVANNWTGDYVVGSNTFADALLILNSGILSNANGYVGYEVAGSNNSVLVTGPGSLWTNGGLLFIGYNADGNTFVISNGAKVFNASVGWWVEESIGGVIGYNCSSNSVVVTDSGSVWSSDDSVQIGYYGSANSLSVRNGGNVSSAFGNLRGNNGTVLITDPGSTWSNRAGFAVWGGYNSLVVSNGGVLCNIDESTVGVWNSGTNTMLVTGADSVWRAGATYWGYAGRENKLAISNGGRVISSEGYIGGGTFFAADNNSVAINGSGSVWSNEGNLYVGSGGVSNSLAISDGGLVLNSNGYIGFDHDNSVLVAGSGSVWSNAGLLCVGHSGANNSLVITNGAKVFNGSVPWDETTRGSIVGLNSSSSNNCVLVTGASSVWSNGGDMYFGNEGPGNSLVVSNAGMVTGDGWSGIGTTAESSDNSVVITGVGSVWEQRQLSVGSASSGNTLVVKNNGKLVTGEILGVSDVSNTVTITGPGAVCSNAAWLIVLGSDNDVLVSNGATMWNGWSATVGYGLEGDDGGTNCSVVVDGSGSTWTVSEWLMLNRDKRLLIENGGQVFSKEAFVGNELGGCIALVSGTGSVWSSSSVCIGYTADENGLVVSNGGQVVDDTAFIGKWWSTRHDRALVTGPGAMWRNTNELYVGRYGGENSLVISNDGKVIGHYAYVGLGYATDAAFGNCNLVCVADGGVWQNDILWLGDFGSSNTLQVAGGMVFATNLIVGVASTGCDNLVQMDNGGLFITNSSGSATFEVRHGNLILNGGTLQVNRFVMTNSCAQLVRTGGTLIYGTAVLDPNLDADGDGIPNGYEQSHGLDPLDPSDANIDSDGDGFSNLQEYLAGTDPTNSASAFRITSVTATGNDVFVSWMTGMGRTNALQSSAGDSGLYTNDFSDIFTVTNAVATTTNYLDIGAATNVPARYYRVRLVP